MSSKRQDLLDWVTLILLIVPSLLLMAFFEIVDSVRKKPRQ